MNSRKNIDVAIGKVEDAVASLIIHARRFPDIPEHGQIRNLLAAGRVRPGDRTPFKGPGAIVKITYVTEDPGKQYVKSVRAAKTLADLRKVVAGYKLLAADAIATAAAMDDAAFAKWRKGLPLTQGDKFPGEDWMNAFGVVLLPLVMMEVSLTATQFGAPWGTAYIQLRKYGRIVEADGVATLVAQVQK